MRAAAAVRYGQGGGDQISVIQAQGEETAAKTEASNWKGSAMPPAPGSTRWSAVPAMPRWPSR